MDTHKLGDTLHFHAVTTDDSQIATAPTSIKTTVYKNGAAVGALTAVDMTSMATGLYAGSAAITVANGFANGDRIAVYATAVMGGISKTALLCEYVVVLYPAALLNTTIASLSSQTVFTLTNGPAEDSALAGMELVVHDVASAVQMSVVSVSSFVGLTKTITLLAAPTFTIAAGDNVSVMRRDARSSVGMAAANLDTRLLSLSTDTSAIFTRCGTPSNPSTGSLAQDIADVKAETASLVSRVGAWTGSGVNTILGAFKALLSKNASTPSDIGGTFSAATDSTEAIADASVGNPWALVLADNMTVGTFGKAVNDLSTCLKTGTQIDGVTLDVLLKTLLAVAAGTRPPVNSDGEVIFNQQDGETAQLTLTRGEAPGEIIESVIAS